MKLIFIPYAGLGNRMRAIASAYKHSIENNIELEIHWNRENGLNASFFSLFKPVDSLKIKDSKLLSYFIYNHPNKTNLHMPQLVDKLFGRKSFYGIGINKLQELPKVKSVICSTYSQQGELHPLAELFKPVENIEKIINDNKRKFGKYTVGVHIRRTDNVNSINNSKIELFYEKINTLFMENPDAKVFLCTDDIKTKEEIIAKWGRERIITYNSTLSRNSYKGIRDAVVELFTLASTDVIWGSYFSSYTEIASQLFNKELVIIK